LPGVIQFSRDACRAAWLALVLALAAAPSAAQHHEREDTPSTAEDPTGPAGEGNLLDSPALAPLPITEGFRIRLQTLVAPEASIGHGDVTLVRPELNARATWPVNDKMVLRLTTRLAENQYRFHGDVWGSEAQLPQLGIDPDKAFDDLDLHSAQLGLEGAYSLSRDTHWLAKQEEWALVGALYAGSRWEDDSFHSGVGAGGAIGIGYEIPENLRVALGVSLRTPLDHTDIDVGPFVSLRWRPIEHFTLRSRELGLQAEYELTPVFEVYLAGFRSTDRFRLNDRKPLGDLSFRDRRVQVGAGFEWKLSNWLHLMAEGGSIVDRRLRVREEDLDTVLSRNGGPSGYCELRIELRL
jgi:hypothetical protein